MDQSSRPKGKVLHCAAGEATRMKRLRVFIFTLLFIIHIHFRNCSNSNNLPAASQSVRKCTHVDSKEDEVCGGLWHATQYTGMPSNVTLSQKKIHIIVSHCMSSLDWFPKYTEGFNITSIQIISKCGEEVKGAPDGVVVHVLPNVGRCDHSFVYFITTIYPIYLQANTENQLRYFSRINSVLQTIMAVNYAVLNLWSRLRLHPMDLDALVRNI